jgi:hypothetical protein
MLSDLQFVIFGHLDEPALNAIYSALDRLHFFVDQLKPLFIQWDSLELLEVLAVIFEMGAVD